ncbi:glycosyltransferase family 2 protein [Pasteurellaceae bacterium LIM206]|nr:glycosyltransferase family 2 protein [Pasteurellaceae bacterium LIM206]
MFSIIVPSYNRNEEIASLLNSLERQSLHNFEVIIVDDCSPTSVQVEQGYSFAVRVIRNNANQGPAESRNIGARHARYDWLLFLDDDDRFTPNKCQLLTQKIAENPTVNFIYHPAECVMVNERFIYRTHPFSNVADITLDNLLLANKIGGMPMLGIAKSLFRQINGLSTQLKSLEDYDFILKVISQPDFKPLYIDEALTVCRFYTKRASVSTNTGNTEQAIRAIQRQYVHTPRQARNFRLNALYMLAYPHAMSLSRKAAWYYFKMFLIGFNVKYLLIAGVSFLSPKLAINLKRFI